MREIRRLLVALDLHRGGRALTAGSCIAVDQALDLAAAIGSEVVLLHARGSDEAQDAGESAVAAPDGTARARRPALEEIADRFRSAGIAIEVATSDEPAPLGIIRRVLRDRIELVITGKRNAHRRADPSPGSVSLKLLRECPCAVWVAKPGGDTAVRCVLAASDLTPVSERVIEIAAFVAAHYRAALHVVHVFTVSLEQKNANRAREERTRLLEAQLARAHSAPGAAIHVQSGSPARAIMACHERLAPDLVVMGTVSRGGLAGILVGNTAERLVGSLDCSLLTVKPIDFVCPVSPLA